MSHRVRQQERREAFTNMVQHISRRPSMYTYHGGFWEVVAYLEGYSQGAGNPTGEYGRGMQNGLSLFGDWLARRRGDTEHAYWAEALLKYCGDDEQQAVQQLGALYAEYWRDKQ